MMKKIAFIISILLLSATTNISAQVFKAPTERCDSLYFEILSDSTVAVTKQMKTIITDTLVIPQTVTYNGVGYKVVKILSEAFVNPYCGRCLFNHVVIPEGIFHFGAEAFAHNDSLKNITFPSSCQEILSGVISRCRNMKWADFSRCNFNWLDNHVFDDNSSLQWVKFPKTLKFVHGAELNGNYSQKFVLFPSAMDSMILPPRENIGMNIPFIFTSLNKVRVSQRVGIKGQRIPIYYQGELDSLYKNDSFWNDSSYYILHPSHFLKDGYMDLDSICPWEAERLYGFHPDTVGVYIVEKHNPNDCDSFNIYFVNSILNPGEIYDTTINIEPDKEDTSVLWTWEGTAFAYNVYRDGSYITTVEQPSYLDTNIEFNVQYCYNFAPVNEKYCEGKWSTTNCYTMLGVGVQEAEDASCWVLHPNPVKETLLITAVGAGNASAFKGKTAGTGSETAATATHFDGSPYEITDITGRIVLQGQYNATEGIHVGGLAKGIYLLRMEGKVGKFVKE